MLGEPMASSLSNLGVPPQRSESERLMSGSCAVLQGSFKRAKACVALKLMI